MKIPAACILAAAMLAATSAHAAPTTGTAETVTSQSAALNFDPAQKKPADYWSKAVARFKSMETTAPKGAVVLLGDSITARWPAGQFPAPQVNNRGIGSDHIGGWKYFGLLDRLDTSIAALKPSRIFLLIGVNDMLDNGPPMENMKLAYAHLLDQLRVAAPDAQIIVQSILPVSKPQFAYMHEPIKELNAHIRTLAAQRNLTFVDLYTKFADADGKLRAEYSADGVHLSPAGYKHWREILIEQGLGQP